MYHLVCPAKFRKTIFSPEISETIKVICLNIEQRFEIHFLEIGTDKDHVHFLIQSVPTYPPSEIVKKIKSIIARELFKAHPELRKQLWGGKIWSSGYFINTVSKTGGETTIAKYVQNQGQNQYQQILKQPQSDYLL
jgi:putative transposase